MYHGDHVPGFPAHPHRGFETVTIVPQGLVDHADSHGGSARYGKGDVQWLTTGSGIEHGEMFPLIDASARNPLELFQIWLNLPAAGKRAAPGFKIFWDDKIPHHRTVDAEGRVAEVRIVAGTFVPVGGDARSVEPIAPPPASWAADPDNHVAIWLITLDAGAALDLPVAPEGVNRRAYFYGGDRLAVSGVDYPSETMLTLAAHVRTELVNTGAAPVQLLLLQGAPIGQAVVAHGPFVMNSDEEVMQTIRDYQTTGFGGWPWQSREMTYGTEGRFAAYPDGRRETPG